MSSEKNQSRVLSQRSLKPANEPAAELNVGVELLEPFPEARQKFLWALEALNDTDMLVIDHDLSALYQASVDPVTRKQLVTPEALVAYAKVFGTKELAPASGSILSMFHVLAVRSGHPGAPVELVIDERSEFARVIKAQLAAVIAGQGIGFNNRQGQEMAVDIYKEIAAPDEEIPQIPELPPEPAVREGIGIGVSTPETIVTDVEITEIVVAAAEEVFVPQEPETVAIELDLPADIPQEIVPEAPEMIVEVVRRDEPLPDDAIESAPADKVDHAAFNGAAEATTLSVAPPAAATPMSEPAPAAESEVAQKPAAQPIMPAEIPIDPSASFADRFAATFPTLASRIPAACLIDEMALWRRLVNYFPNQAAFALDLKRLMDSRKIFNSSGIQFEFLPQILKGEFAAQNSMADIFCEPNFAMQFVRKDILLEKCKQFSRLMEIKSGKFHDSGSLAVDTDAMQRRLTKARGGRVNDAMVKPIMRIYTKADSPLTDGHLTPAAVHLLQKWGIGFDEVAEIFGENLLDKKLPAVESAPHRAKARPSHTAAVAQFA